MKMQEFASPSSSAVLQQLLGVELCVVHENDENDDFTSERQ